MMLFLRILRDLRLTFRDAQRRFLAKVDVRGPDECWLWKGRKSGRTVRKNGGVREQYGALRIQGRSVFAHRFALFGVAALYRRDKSLHHCDTPLCMNRRHLFAGTTSDNLRDAEEKGRIVRVRGRFARKPEARP